MPFTNARAAGETLYQQQLNSEFPLLVFQLHWHSMMDTAQNVCQLTSFKPREIILVPILMNFWPPLENLYIPIGLELAEMCPLLLTMSNYLKELIRNKVGVDTRSNLFQWYETVMFRSFLYSLLFGSELLKIIQHF